MLPISGLICMIFGKMKKNKIFFKTKIFNLYDFWKDEEKQTFISNGKDELLKI
jgi:hypothetical protein